MRKRSIYITLFIFGFLMASMTNSQATEQYLLQMGHTNKREGDLDGAIKLYKEALEMNPNYEAAVRSLERANEVKEISLLMKSFPEKCQHKAGTFEDKLECAQKYFIMNGEPINPMIIKDLQPWISDSGDQVVAISLVDSQSCNKYFYDNFKVKKEGKYFSVEAIEKNETESSFSYTLEGKTNNGIFVLSTLEWGGGTGHFSGVLFVRIVPGVGFGEVVNDKLELNQKRILIEKIGAVHLGDRVHPEFHIKGNTVFIKTTQDLPPNEENTQKITISLKGEK